MSQYQPSPSYAEPIFVCTEAIIASDVGGFMPSRVRSAGVAERSEHDVVETASERARSAT